jgi:hypothetical protein
MTKKVLILVSLFFILIFQFLQAQQLEIDTTMWVTNGKVDEIIREGNTIYIGGEFTYVGPNTGAGGTINLQDGKLSKTPLLKIDGDVMASVADGKGGWYIGGKFKTVQGVVCNGLAHILPNGVIDKSWNPEPASSSLSEVSIHALALKEKTLYIGGYFYSIGGQKREHLAAVDAITGLATPWYPKANGAVLAIVLTENTIYVGGNFTSIGQQDRGYLAALDLVTGIATDWDPHKNPRVDDSINAIAIAGNLVYVGGEFTTMGGQERSSLAAIDVATGSATDWNPTPSPYRSNLHSTVCAIIVSNNTVYVGGEFNTIGGQERNNLAALNITTGEANSWSPNPNNSVKALAIMGNTLYAGGNFTFIGGQSRYRLAALDATTGQLSSWNPFAEDTVLYNRSDRILVNTLSLLGENIFVGGNFTSIGGVCRNYLASLDATTGQPTSWNPNLNGIVKTLVLSNKKLYVGGSFTSIGGQSRSRLAAIDITSGQVTPWNPIVNDQINTCAISNQLIYIGGFFTSVGGQSRSRLAAIDITSGQVTPWNPDANNVVNTLVLHDNRFYVGGHFTIIDGQNRNYLAAIDIASGQLTPLNPNVSDMNGWHSYIDAMIINDDKLYVGGNFTIIDGQNRNYLAAIDIASGQVTSWNPDVDGGVTSCAILGTTIYIGGIFTSVGGQSRNHVAAIDITSGQVTPWNPDANGTIYCIYPYNESLYIGGDFTKILGRGMPQFALFKKINPLQYIMGKVYEDTDGNCKQDEGEQGIANRIMLAKPGDYFASTDSLGNYTLAVDTGKYIIEQIIPQDKTELTKQICPKYPANHKVDIVRNNTTVSGIDFGTQTNYQPLLWVNVASSRRRRCLRSTTRVTYANKGNKAVETVKIYVKMPEYVVLVDANVAYTMDADSNYVFNIGSLAPNSDGSISIVDSVVCSNSSIRGITQCTKAWITPLNPTVPASLWDESDIELRGECMENGRVRLALHNKGGEGMVDSSSFRIYLDAKLAFLSKYKLSKGDSLILQVPVNGQTLRLEADQRPYHPTKQASNITIEACGTNDEGKVSLNYVNQLPQDDKELEVTINCLPIIDSYDPNDKQVFPSGVTEHRYTPTDTRLNYLIRFQNTGTDVAYKVVVIDTLSAHLDISTLEIGAVSHSYKLSVSGKQRPVLTFTFNNIMLPDSNANERGSHGFINISIQAKEGLQEKTRIDNYADIFFDYNEPVRTNATSNTLFNMPLILMEEVKLTDKVICMSTNKSIEAGFNQTVCETNVLVLNATAPLYGKGRWKLLRGKALMEDASVANTGLSEVGYGENLLEWSVAANNCGDSLRSQVLITRLTNPATPIIKQIGSDTLYASVDAQKYQWYKDGELLLVQTKNIHVEEEGNYQVKAESTDDWHA